MYYIGVILLGLLLIGFGVSIALLKVYGWAQDEVDKDREENER